MPANNFSCQAKGRDKGPANGIKTGWTDEKHMLYLSSMEASFVDQLYDEYNADEALRSSAETRNCTSSFITRGGLSFKVLSGGCWINHDFRSDNKHVGRRDGGSSLSENQWIQHFSSRSARKHAKDAMHEEYEDPESDTQPHVRDSVGSQTSQLDLVNENTEVSDQNFADEDAPGKESADFDAKKRKRRHANPIKDQFVPVEEEEEEAVEVHSSVGSKPRAP